MEWKRSACGTAEALLSLRLVCIVGLTVSHLSLFKISHRSHMGFRLGMLAGQSSTVISWSANHLEVVLGLWAGTKVLMEKEISISIKLMSAVSRWKHKVLQNLLVDGCIVFGLDKTQYKIHTQIPLKTPAIWWHALHLGSEQRCTHPAHRYEEFASERSCRNGSPGSERVRLVQPILPCSQEGWCPKTHPRSQTPEPLPYETAN